MVRPDAERLGEHALGEAVGDAGSSSASSVSASSPRAPTGVLSSWLMLATKSRRTASSRRRSVTSSMTTSTPRRSRVRLERRRPQHERAPGRAEQVDARAGGRPSSPHRWLGRPQLGDGLLDQRLAVASGEVGRRPPSLRRRVAGVVEDDDALRDHRQRAGEPAHPRASRRSPSPSTSVDQRAPRTAMAPSSQARDGRLGVARRGAATGATGPPLARRPAPTSADQRRPPSQGSDGSARRSLGRLTARRPRGPAPRATPGVLGQPARDHVPDPLADVHGVVADALVVATDQRELHGRLHVARRRRGARGSPGCSPCGAGRAGRPCRRGRRPGRRRRRRRRPWPARRAAPPPRPSRCSRPRSRGGELGAVEAPGGLGHVDHEVAGPLDLRRSGGSR